MPFFFMLDYGSKFMLAHTHTPLFLICTTVHLDCVGIMAGSHLILLSPIRYPINNDEHKEYS